MAEYGIQVEDSNGQLKSTYDVLSELKPIWDSMNDSQRVALGTVLAGKNQYKVLASVMQNFSTATEATAAALNSSGSAARENARYMESIEARVTAVSAAFQKMSMAVVDSDLVKGILDVVKGLADFGATDVGSTITQIILLSGVSWGGLQLLGQSILPGIIGAFTNFNAVLQAGSVAAAAEATEVSTLTMGLSASLPVILAVVGGITALIAIIKAIKSAYDAANPSVEEAALAMKNAQEAATNAENSYNNAKEKLDALNATDYADRTSEIQAEIEELEQLVAYYEELMGIRGGQATAATSSYISTVEKQGFGAGTYTGQITRYSDYLDVAPSVENLAQSYHSLEAAVYAAAKAQYEFDGTIVDVSSVSVAQAQLEELGWTFKENTISTDTVRNSLENIYDEIARGEALTPSLVDKYNDLTDSSEQYAEALRRQKDNGIELTDSQQAFLDTYDKTVAAYNDYIQSVADGNNITVDQVEKSLEAAAALSTYAQNLLAAASAYDTFKNRLAETGDYDDSFKGLTSVFSELNSEWEKGQVGSQAFLTALELLTGQSFASAEAVEYMNNNLDTLNLLFGDSESGGMGLITALEDLGYATLDADGNLQVSIDDFGALADQLGISESSLYAVTEALRVMGIDFQYNSEDILNNIAKLGDGIVEFGDTTTVNFEAYTKAAKEAGMSNDDIIAISEVLTNTADVELTNVAEGMALLGSNSEEASSSASDAANNYEEVGNTSGGIANASDAMSDLAANTAAAADSAASLSNSLSSVSSFKAPSFGSLLKGLIGHAEGTSHAKEGDALVNEEGAELIQSGDKAYIAGGGFPTITRLHEGDKVYTAEETKDILKGGKLSSPIQAHALGTRVNINDGGSGRKKVSGTGVGGGTASVSAAILAGLNRGTGGTTGDSSGSSSASSASSDSSSTSDTSDINDIKKEFDEWLKAKKHALAMDEITEEEYYNALKEMNDKYFKGKEEYQDEYRKYQEQIYSWEKKQEEERAKEKQKQEEEAAKQRQKQEEEAKKAYKAEFDNWLKERKHTLAMGEISEEEYYNSLREMNDKYFKGKEEYQDEYWKYQEQIYSWEKKQEEEKAKAAEKAAEEAKKLYENEFKVWLKEQNHALAMGQISEEEYYTALEEMNNKYFKDNEEYQDEYWKYEEQIYAWKKKQAEDEAKAQEQALKEQLEAQEKAFKAQIELEKKLNELAKAQASRIKVFENGQFRYVSDREALAKAQEALSSYGNGTLSASGGLSLVGENGAEMRVLNKGDGIIPSNITKNLWNWGSLDPSIFASKRNDNSIYNFDISNLDLPNVHNATDFVNGLKSFALQYIAQRG